jgi:chaperonin cofactor prefoldin
LKEDLKTKEAYISTLEEQSRSMTKRVSDLEIHLKTVKSECVEAMSNKENALREQFKTFEYKNNQIQAEHEQLKKQLIRE